MNSKLVFSEPYLKSTLSTNLPHHKCARRNNHRMWMPRECQCNQDKLVKESSKTTWQHSSSLHEDYLNIPSAFLHRGKSFDTSSCSATRSRCRWAPTPPPPTTQDLSTWTKPSGIWLQLEALITAAHQPPEREVAHIYPACHVFLLPSPVRRNPASPHHIPLCSGIKHGSSEQIEHRKPVRKVENYIKGCNVNQLRID